MVSPYLTAFDDIEDDDDGYLTGQLIVAMPGMGDPRFDKSVIYLCAHSEEGAMGLVINREIEELTFPDLLEQLDIEPAPGATPIRIQFGGPVESSRGFVLHSPDYLQDGTLVVDDGMALTATVDILRAIADGSGPTSRLLALGYAGWGPGQLDSEIKDNGWLHVEADGDLVFDTDLGSKWDRAMTKIGIDPFMLSDVAGHA
ncbi:MAG: YqgE/AlgH family protein [Rhodospirillales bacterium]|jgi:putative transcriptional regulator|nr:YqgE/AlgH family protein [Rhodospirillales bacterium]MBT4041411.1 YqgE/AlgH family protein [Rhodospirillales bacterium]MBT4628292.1 YqgE/AlgH family protein [Rhodospirillales bacterium]MBT5352306.1 YqgE/AlgH family protein [Rhodospirillales bacterium]MBT5521045.1 YqgE/AlgH family protein [Rhodospirillales bacterium]